MASTAAAEDAAERPIESATLPTPQATVPAAAAPAMRLAQAQGAPVQAGSATTPPSPAAPSGGNPPGPAAPASATLPGPAAPAPNPLPGPAAPAPNPLPASASVPVSAPAASATLPVAAPPSTTVPLPPLPAATRVAAPPGVPNTTVKLIELLIQNGLVTRDQADSLLREAQAEAAAARGAAPRAARSPAAPPAPVPAAEAVAPGTVRVPYVPEIVRRQIREEVTRDVVAQMRSQAPLPPMGARRGPSDGPALAQGGEDPPNLRPGQISDRLAIYGDLRLRYQGSFFPSGNAAGFFPNFFSINNSATGFDLAGNANAPFLNVTENRNAFRLRARLGVEAKLADWITSDVRIATGNDSSPVSANQTFGAVNAAGQQYGSFGKYAIWLDRAYLRMTPAEWLRVDVGRMPNPFRSTDLLYHVDLGMDGVAARATHRFGDEISAFVTAGVFPYYNTDFNFSSTDVQKTGSRDRYMVGAQAGADWRFAEGWAFNLNLGYYNFMDSQGALSSPCQVPYAADACNTDNSRAFFTQNTNTFFPVRNLVPNPQNPTGPQPQYFGLASRFEVLDIYTRLDYGGFAPLLLTLEGNYVNNLGFNRNQILSRGLLTDGAPNGIANNIGASNRFVGGNQGYLLRFTVGHKEVEQRWAWNAFFTYRYLESDAVLDALNDSDFRLGGTNSKGYIIGGTLGIAENAFLRARWFSGQQVAGPRYAADVVLIDLQGRF